MHGAIAIGHDRGAIEGERVLPAHHVDVQQGRAGFAGALGQQRVALGVLAAFVWGRIGDHHQLGTVAHGIGQRFGEPQVFADQHAHGYALQLEHAAAAIRVDVEITAFVEHRIVGQFALAVGVQHLAVAQHAGGVVDHCPGGLGPANHRGDAVRGFGDPAHGHLAVVQEARAQQQVFGRVAADGQLGEHHQLGAELIARLGDHRDDVVGVLRDRAHRKIELGHRDADRRHGVKPVVAMAHCSAGGSADCKSRKAAPWGGFSFAD